MLLIGNVTVSDDLYLVRFCCNLPRCQGACCVGGDAGAPLEEAEIGILQDEYENFKSYMTEGGIKTVEEHGILDYDPFGKFATPLVNDGECAFANFSNGIAHCAIERAFFDNKTSFRKPISCHLYPLRITEHEQFDAVNYHKWNICKPALKKGNREGVPLYKFLKSALVRKYGEEWYKALEREIASFSTEK